MGKLDQNLRYMENTIPLRTRPAETPGSAKVAHTFHPQYLACSYEMTTKVLIPYVQNNPLVQGLDVRFKMLFLVEFVICEQTALTLKENFKTLLCIAPENLNQDLRPNGFSLCSQIQSPDVFHLNRRFTRESGNPFQTLMFFNPQFRFRRKKKGELQQHLEQSRLG